MIYAHLFASIEAMEASGFSGGILHYALIIAIVGSAFLLFLNFWMRGRLDMDEEPKFQMMQTEENQ